MNQKEIRELRRRVQPEKNAFQRLYGCYVNSARQIVSYLDASFGAMRKEEEETYLAFLKKTLSGTLGKNLVDIVFSTQQVMEGEEHRLLRTLRDSALQDREAREALYQRMIQSLDLGDSSYLILLAAESYDVPHRSRNDEWDSGASEQVFRYFLCCVCPVKDATLALRYDQGENEFHTGSGGKAVTAPVLGFLFPAFDDRRANIHNALFYTRTPANLHPELLEAIFRCEPLLSAEEQKDAFSDALTLALGEPCSFSVLQGLHGRLRESLLLHKESRDPEPLRLSQRELAELLQKSGAAAEQVEAFRAACGERFGEGAALQPENIIDSKKFALCTAQAKVTLDPDYGYLAETRVIDGKTYLLLPADEGLQLNGMNVK